MSNDDMRSLDTTLPQDWAWTRLEDVTSPNRVPVQPSAQQQLPFIGMEYVEAETMRLLGTGQSSGLRSIALHFWPGDVLYGRLRPYLNKVLHADFEGLCSAEFIIFRDAPFLDSRYLQYFLNDWRFRDFAARLNEGDRPRVDWDQIKPYPFPLAPIGEQRRIVAAIEQQFTRLDAGVAALKRAQARLKRYRAAVLKAAVEGELTAEWREAHPATETGAELLQRILAERRARWEADLRAKGKDPAKARYEEPAGPDAAGLPKVPEGWCWTNLAQTAYSVRYGSSAKTSTDSSGVPVLRMGNIQDGVLDLVNLKYLPSDHAEFPALLLQSGDLLFNRTNSPELVGKSAVYHDEPRLCSFASYLIGSRMLHGCSADYICFFLNSLYGRNWVATVVTQQVGQANVNGTKLQAMAFPLPPVLEQQQIVAEVERRLSIITALETSAEANLKRAERLRQSVLREAFAGRLVPQDLMDEPASILLERIRTERTERPPSRGRRSGVQQLELADAIAANS